MASRVAMRRLATKSTAAKSTAVAVKTPAAVAGAAPPGSTALASAALPKEAAAKWSDHQAVREQQMLGVRFVATDLAAQPLPTPAIDLISQVKIIELHSREAVCDGGGGPLGHPRVYINLDHGTGVCTYCGLRFRQTHDHDAVDHHGLHHAVAKH